MTSDLPPVDVRDDCIDLWYTRTSEAGDPLLLAKYGDLLTPEERDRERRYAFLRDREAFRITRALVRTVLSRYHPIDAKGWRFRAGAYGKPAIAEPAGVAIEFNLSHTRGLVVCAVTGAAAIGVDVENIRRKEIEPGLAERYFSAAEVAALQSTAAADWHERFFDFWTLKESYIKARGMGLSLPLDGFAILPDADGAPRIGFSPAIADNPQGWSFAQFQLDGCYRIAIAAERPEMTIRVAQCVPMVRGAPGEPLEPSPRAYWNLDDAG
jgi:4'-phosphopantetheinyl transferase